MGMTEFRQEQLKQDFDPRVYAKSLIKQVSVVSGGQPPKTIILASLQKIPNRKENLVGVIDLLKSPIFFQDGGEEKPIPEDIVEIVGSIVTGSKEGQNAEIESLHAEYKEFRANKYYSDRHRELMESSSIAQRIMKFQKQQWEKIPSQETENTPIKFEEIKERLRAIRLVLKLKSLKSETYGEKEKDRDQVLRQLETNIREVSKVHPNVIAKVLANHFLSNGEKNKIEDVRNNMQEAQRKIEFLDGFNDPKEASFRSWMDQMIKKYHDYSQGLRVNDYGASIPRIVLDTSNIGLLRLRSDYERTLGNIVRNSSLILIFGERSDN